ncbi:transposase [Salmonella enterica subsp. enterica]|nr:transposase [Salmonella enterica subsp. enterica]
MLRLDKGPEFISLALAEWAKKHVVKLAFIQPGKPKKNVFIERFNRHTVQKYSILICSER